MKQIIKTDSMDVQFLQTDRPYSLESPFEGEDYVCLLFINDSGVTNEEQGELSRDLVLSGCRYAVCSGYDCSSWDDAIDQANLDRDPDLTDDLFVMTTWHIDEPISDIVFFGLLNTNFDDNVFDKYLLLFVGGNAPLLSEVELAVKKHAR